MHGDVLKSMDVFYSFPHCADKRLSLMWSPKKGCLVTHTHNKRKATVNNILYTIKPALGGMKSNTRPVCIGSLG